MWLASHDDMSCHVSYPLAIDAATRDATAQATAAARFAAEEASMLQGAFVTSYADDDDDVHVSRPQSATSTVPSELLSHASSHASLHAQTQTHTHTLIDTFMNILHYKRVPMTSPIARAWYALTKIGEWMMCACIDGICVHVA